MPRCSGCLIAHKALWRAAQLHGQRTRLCFSPEAKDDVPESRTEGIPAELPPCIHFRLPGTARGPVRQATVCVRQAVLKVFYALPVCL